MSYTLASAAAARCVNKATILRAIKNGKVSGTKDEHGEWQLESAEVHRVYPPVKDAAAGTDVLPGSEPQQRAAQAEEKLSELKVLLEDLRGDRDAWRDQAQRLALPDAADTKPMPLWRWLRTTG